MLTQQLLKAECVKAVGVASIEATVIGYQSVVADFGAVVTDSAVRSKSE